MSITGTCKSRLVELKKYKVTNDFNLMYRADGSDINDGVDYNQSLVDTYVTYYLGGIKYYDDLVANTTVFELTPQGLTNPVFINKPIIKDLNKNKIIGKPRVINDVLITRQEISVFDKNKRLAYIKNISDLITYAGGNYYKIINNT